MRLQWSLPESAKIVSSAERLAYGTSYRPGRDRNLLPRCRHEEACCVRRNRPRQDELVPEGPSFFCASISTCSRRPAVITPGHRCGPESPEFPAIIFEVQTQYAKSRRPWPPRQMIHFAFVLSGAGDGNHRQSSTRPIAVSPHLVETPCQSNRGEAPARSSAVPFFLIGSAKSRPLGAKSRSRHCNRIVSRKAPMRKQERNVGRPSGSRCCCVECLSNSAA